MKESHSFFPEHSGKGAGEPLPPLPEETDADFHAFWYGNESDFAVKALKPADPAMASLVTLLEDNDEKIASSALLELLKYEGLDEVVALNQDADGPALRRHIHQLAVILEHRRIRRLFLKEYRRNTLMPWDALLAIHVLMDTRRSMRSLERQVRMALPDEAPPQAVS